MATAEWEVPRAVPKHTGPNRLDIVSACLVRRMWEGVLTNEADKDRSEEQIDDKASLAGSENFKQDRNLLKEPLEAQLMSHHQLHPSRTVIP